MSHPIPPAEETGAPKLPDLNQATLDWAGVEALLRDIAACAQVTEIIPKAAAQGYVTDGVTLSLVDARRLLEERAVRGLQACAHSAPACSRCHAGKCACGHSAT